MNTRRFLVILIGAALAAATLVGVLVDSDLLAAGPLAVLAAAIFAVVVDTRGRVVPPEMIVGVSRTVRSTDERLNDVTRKTLAAVESSRLEGADRVDFLRAEVQQLREHTERLQERLDAADGSVASRVDEP